MEKISDQLYLLIRTNNAKGVANYLKQTKKPIPVDEAWAIGDFFDPNRAGPVKFPRGIAMGRISGWALVQYYYRITSGDFEFAERLGIEIHGKTKGDCKYWLCRRYKFRERAFDDYLAAFNREAANFFLSLLNEQEDTEDAKEIVSSRYGIPHEDIEKILKRYT